MIHILTIYLGENQSEKLRRYSKDIKALLSEKKEVICVVPDQFSFAYDKALYSRLGPKDFNKVKVFSFRRLSEAFIDKYGTCGGSLLSRPERMIIIYLAIRRVKSKKSLRLLSRSLDKSSFARDAAEIIDSLRRNGLRPEILDSAAESLGGTLGDKLGDISKIYAEYDELLKARSVRDESSIISEGAERALANKAFKGAHVYIDRFDSFSTDELLVIKAAIRDAVNVTVSIPIPSELKNSPVSPFTHCISTQNSLIDLAAQTGVAVRYKHCSVPKTDNKLLCDIGSCLYTSSNKKSIADNTLTIRRAENMYEEADYTASEIRRLVTREGYNFNDIAVITHDMDSYLQPLEAAFERYGIEAYTDRTQPALECSMIIFALDAIDAAASRVPDTDKILKYLRSPFSPLTHEEISILWDYCVRWNVEGQMWLNPFTAGDYEMSEQIRKKAIEPLKRLNNAAKSATSKETAVAFCEFLKETNAAEKAFSVIEDCADEDLKLETARLFKQLWTALMGAISSIYMTAGEEKLTLKAFSELLRLILSDITVSSPPQKLESVTIADVTRSVIDSPKISFVIGLADGLFPAEIKKTGLFSGRDIQKLESAGISLDISPETRLASERFDCYKALTSSTERLILTWAGQDLRGRELRPSRFIRRITDCCGARILTTSNQPVEIACSTPEAAYYGLSVLRTATASEKASISSALMTIPEYREKLARLSAVNSTVHRLSPCISRKLFVEKDINVTASRIDVYNRCNFQYFCKYGLKINPVTPLEIDPANRGTVMHYLFETVLFHFGSDFSEASDEDIKSLVEKLLYDFSNKILGGDFGKSAKFKADYARLGSAAIEILLNMREEFKVSKFRPERFEYDLSRENGESVLSVSISDGIKINLRGIADRVDTYTSPEGKKYIRIVDYKTGEKRFSYEDIYNGINLQLLLYMLALTEGKDADFNDCVPGGVLYMKAGFLECDDDYDPLNPDQKSRFERSAEQLRRSGLVIDSEEVIEAMDKSFSGRFAPVKKTASGKYTASSQLISEKSFKILEDYARLKTVRFGQDILNGKIDAVPLGIRPDSLPCAYCDYASVCGRRKYMYRLIKKEDAEELKVLISGGEK